VKERRRQPRVSASGVRARIRTGHRLVVIDVSAGGALVEAGQPLPPGSLVEVHLESDHQHGRLAARVVRCAVAAIDTESGITYRAALSFNESCDWVCESTTPTGYDVPEQIGMETSARERAVERLPSRGLEPAASLAKGTK